MMHPGTHHPQPGDAGGPTAVLLHPDPFVRRKLRRALGLAGCPQVLEAGSAAEATRHIVEGLVDVVLAPWGLEGQSGPMLAAGFKGRRPKRVIPVIVLDDGLSQADVVSAVKAGVVGRLLLEQDGPAMASHLRTLLARLGESGQE